MINIYDYETYESIQFLLEYYISGCTKQEIIDYFWLDSNSSNYGYELLKIRKTLEQLLELGFVKLVTKRKKQYYMLIEEV